VNGKEHGIRKIYNQSGTLRLVSPYVNGKKHGIEKRYFLAGALYDTRTYVNGVLIWEI
jgi:antitoxin component YwqK of YwqJK toxin-antitoxin module